MHVFSHNHSTQVGGVHVCTSDADSHLEVTGAGAGRGGLEDAMLGASEGSSVKTGWMKMESSVKSVIEQTTGFMCLSIDNK